jgi:hypothetical protein
MSLHKEYEVRASMVQMTPPSRVWVDPTQEEIDQ